MRDAPAHDTATAAPHLLSFPRRRESRDRESPCHSLCRLLRRVFSHDFRNGWPVAERAFGGCVTGHRNRVKREPGNWHRVNSLGSAWWLGRWFIEPKGRIAGRTDSRPSLRGNRTSPAAAGCVGCAERSPDHSKPLSPLVDDNAGRHCRDGDACFGCNRSPSPIIHRLWALGFGL